MSEEFFASKYTVLSLYNSDTANASETALGTPFPPRIPPKSPKTMSFANLIFNIYFRPSTRRSPLCHTTYMPPDTQIVHGTFVIIIIILPFGSGILDLR